MGHFLSPGIKCSSMVGTNVGTSRRSVLTPMGDESQASVRYANGMAARQSLLLYLVTALGGVWFLEQAASSVLMETDRLIQFRSHVTVSSFFGTI